MNRRDCNLVEYRVWIASPSGAVASPSLYSCGDQYRSIPERLTRCVLDRASRVIRLFDHNYSCEVLNIEYHYFDDFDDYEFYISDHRPVAIKIQF